MTTLAECKRYLIGTNGDPLYVGIEKKPRIVREVYVEEISASGEWAKVAYLNGDDGRWVKVDQCEIIEELPDLDMAQYLVKHKNLITYQLRLDLMRSLTSTAVKEKTCQEKS